MVTWSHMFPVVNRALLFTSPTLNVSGVRGEEWKGEGKNSIRLKEKSIPTKPHILPTFPTIRGDFERGIERGIERGARGGAQGCPGLLSVARPRSITAVT